eukprot:CAMPEP_0174971008 /NCGR_PEP_ID=MMETSP0004_2-20121128/9737_1 /TAXON_ID=420556 /ORGANISM="Ochromonas sp., Strain CCMP1393" /LENGTH=124 /DNA_ID=CAMNT_0016220877 /DNA_START=47 /DNA_END=421 /DNA_ORIENTATION=+
MALTSTPNAGGISPRTGSSKGSVGHTATLYGNFLRSVLGYHENTVLHMKKKLNTLTSVSKTGRTTLITAMSALSAALAIRGYQESENVDIVEINAKSVEYFGRDSIPAGSSTGTFVAHNDDGKF